MLNTEYIKYKKLMRIKRLFISFLVIFLVLMGILMEKFKIPDFLFITALAIYLYISTFIFLAKNICPWCNQSFFLFGKSSIPNTPLFPFQTKCLNCNKPNSDEDIYCQDEP